MKETLKQKFKNATEFIRAGLANGCTGVPDFNVKPCCDVHDFDYYDLTKGKLKADWDFLKCMLSKAKKQKTIKDKLATAGIGISYYVGVSVFGFFYWKGKQNETVNKILRGVDANAGPIGSERL